MLKIKQLIKKIDFFYRTLTWEKRALPDFIIVGAQKAGTTSLFDYLSKHPQLSPPNKKEIHYFDGGLDPEIDTYKKGERWYRSHFLLKSKLNQNKTFEASPLYLFNPLAPARINKLLPNVKLIILLRNPVERAISQYHHGNKKEKWDDAPILEAMKMEEERIKEDLETKNYKSKRYIKYSYKARGKYREQLERYFNLFPKENILIINSEVFFQNPRDVLKDVLKFVGVDAKFEFQNLSPKNIGNYKQKDVKNEVTEYLKEYFIEPNEELYKLLGEKFDW